MADWSHLSPVLQDHGGFRVAAYFNLLPEMGAEGIEQAWLRAERVERLA